MAGLTFAQIREMTCTLFTNVNLLVVDFAAIRTSKTAVKDLRRILTEGVGLAHDFFLKNRYRRMKAWVGLSGADNDLSLLAASHTHKSLEELGLKLLQSSGIRDAASYPEVSIPTMTSMLMAILSSNNPVKRFIRYRDIVLANVDIESTLEILPERRFLIREFLIESWNFPAHVLLYDELVFVCLEIFKRALQKLPSSLDIQIPSNQLCYLILKVREHYRGGNDFHNFRHAVDVVQAIFYYCLSLDLLDKASLISQRMIVHKHKRERSGTKTPPTGAEALIDLNEQTIENNDDLSKESEELDPMVEYSTYTASPKLYLNQLKTYQSIIDVLFPRDKHVPRETIVDTEYGSFKQTYKSELLEPLEVLALLLAALGHDTGHPGLTNHFMSTNKSPLAILFNDQLVLENYHFIVFNQILLRFWPQLFDDKVVAQVTKKPICVKKIISQSVLATDMERHFAFIDEIKNLERDSLEGAWGIPKLKILAELLCQLLLKCADILNITRPLKLSATWGGILGKEMAEVAKLDHMLKLTDILSSNGIVPSEELHKAIEAYEGEDPERTKDLVEILTILRVKSSVDKEVSTIPQCTLRELLDKNPEVCKSQIFFIEKISYKLFVKINRILPWLSFTLKILDKNLAFWKTFYEERKVE